MLQLAQEPEADALLDRDPFALLVGMLLDQQFPMERAFAGPAVIAERLGVDHLDPADDLIAVADEVGADFIVIGLRRRTPVGKLILGSNAQRILLDAPCPVLAVKAEED